MCHNASDTLSDNATDDVSDNAIDDVSDNATDDVSSNATARQCTKGQSMYFRDICYLYL